MSCELVSRCSGQGICSGPNVCTCHSGYKGINCSECKMALSLKMSFLAFLCFIFSTLLNKLSCVIVVGKRRFWCRAVKCPSTAQTKPFIYCSRQKSCRSCNRSIFRNLKNSSSLLISPRVSLPVKTSGKHFRSKSRSFPRSNRNFFLLDFQQKLPLEHATEQAQGSSSLFFLLPSCSLGLRACFNLFNHARKTAKMYQK